MAVHVTESIAGDMSGVYPNPVRPVIAEAFRTVWVDWVSVCASISGFVAMVLPRTGAT